MQTRSVKMREVLLHVDNLLVVHLRAFPMLQTVDITAWSQHITLSWSEGILTRIS